MKGKRLLLYLVAAFLTMGPANGTAASPHGASASFAEERFQWRGQVDGTDEILIRGQEVRVRHLAAKPIQRQDYRFTAPLPEWDVDLQLLKIEGRGEVRLVEEPSSWNDYTAVVRIDDEKQLGDSYYEFELTWSEGDDWSDWGDSGGGGDPADAEDEWGSENDDVGNDPDDWDWDQEGGAFRWEGRVDVGAEIRIHGAEHVIDGSGGEGTQEYRSRFTSALPESEVPVSLRHIEGRGSVELWQTPAAENNYTAIVRIEDTSSGSDTYEFELAWRLR